MNKKPVLQIILGLFVTRKYNIFRARACDVRRMSLDTLQEILKRNRNTEYGRKYNFAALKTVKAYQKQVPVTTYQDYEESIERMMQGAGNILTADKISLFGLTSGTTGKFKTVPITGKSLKNIMTRVIPLVLLVYLKYFPGTFRNGRGLNLINSSTPQFTQSGIPVSPVTGSNAGKMQPMLAAFNSSPKEILKSTDYQQTLYIHLLFALKNKKLKHINAAFSSTVLDLFHCLETKWQALLADLESGSINREIILDPDTRQVLQKKLRTHTTPALTRKRIAELQAAYARGMTGIAARIWPYMVHIVTTAGGSFAVYAAQCRHYLGAIPIYSPFYTATEGFLGINLEPGNMHYTLLTGNVFLEFIPVAALDEALDETINETIDEIQPQCLTAEEVQVGEEYEIVLTSYSGFYRYRLGDIVKVVKHFNRIPVIEFIRRKGTLLNLAAEKTGTGAVFAAIKAAFPEKQYAIVDFTVYPDHDNLPGYYDFYMEFENPGLSGEELRMLETRLDKSLGGYNPRYKAAREVNKISSLKIRLLKTGSFTAYKLRLISGGTSANQVKIPHVITDKNKLVFFQAQVIEGILC